LERMIVFAFGSSDSSLKAGALLVLLVLLFSRVSQSVLLLSRISFHEPCKHRNWEMRNHHISKRKIAYYNDSEISTVSERPSKKKPVSNSKFLNPSLPTITPKGSPSTPCLSHRHHDSHVLPTTETGSPAVRYWISLRISVYHQGNLIKRCRR